MAMMPLLIAAVSILAALGYAAARWGVDTREWTVGVH